MIYMVKVVVELEIDDFELLHWLDDHYQTEEDLDRLIRLLIRHSHNRLVKDGHTKPKEQE